MSRAKKASHIFTNLSLALILALAGLLNGSLFTLARAQAENDLPNPVTTGTTAASAIPWTIRPVDVGVEFTDMTDRSLALDSEDNSHIAYGKEHLYYAYFDYSWHFETVDANYGVGRYAAITIDSADYPHFSYYDSVNGNLMYAHKEGINTSIHSFPSPANDGAYTSLALDASDHPHISYYDITNGDLKYAHWDGANWSTTTVDSSGNVGKYTSLALDDADHPVIAYYDVTNGNLKLAIWSGSIWNIQTVDAGGDGDVGSFASLALDSTFVPAISYYDATNQDLKIAQWDGDSWVVETVVSTGEVGQYTSLAFNTYDNPNISYYNATEDLLNLTYWTYLGWDTDDHTLDGCKFSSIAIDDEGLVGDNGFTHISCSSAVYMWHTLEIGWHVWSNAQLDIKHSTGRHSDITIDPSGAARISYNDSNYGNLFYAYVTSSSQALEYVDFIDGTGTYTSIVLDTSGNPHISYLDETADRLKYAHYTGSEWIKETLDPTTLVWGNTSIVLDRNNYPHIAYQTLASVKYVYWNGASWVYQIVGAGSKPSLSLDTNDNPSVSYYSSAGLSFAHWDGANWVSETVDPGQSGLYTSLALDSAGSPHISYGFGPLKYASWTGSAWDIQTVDSSINAGFYHALALDRADNPHISYSVYQNTAGGCDIYHLKYARWSEDTWIIETVDDAGGVGEFNALALDAAGNPHISYYDCPNGNLKYAVGSLLPSLDFSSAAYAFGEGVGMANVLVNLSSASLETVTVNYATSEGTASDSRDYMTTSGTLTFTPGDTSESILVPVLDDLSDEPPESLTLTLSNASNATLGTLNNPATLTTLTIMTPCPA